MPASLLQPSWVTGEVFSLPGDLSILTSLSLSLSASLQLAKTQGNVFATDAILATLMSCTRSVYSWDIVVQRVGSKLFFDKRDNSDFGK